MTIQTGLPDIGAVLLCLLQTFSMLNTCKELFVNEPLRYFVNKNSKIQLPTLVSFLMSLSSHSLQNEMLLFYNNGDKAPRKSSLHNRLALLTHGALQIFFKIFTKLLYEKNTIRTVNGYLLCAQDGSDLRIPLDWRDASTYYKNSPDNKGYALTHLNVLFDVMNNRVVDCYISPSRLCDERNAYVNLLRRIQLPNMVRGIITALDRGYECWQVIIETILDSQMFVCRAKDITSNGILSKFNLSQFINQDGTLDINLKIKLISSANKCKRKLERSFEQVAADLYSCKYVVLRADKFEELNTGSDEVEVQIRVVRFMTKAGTYMTVITNLPKDEFSIDDIAVIYRARWKEETFFRYFKHYIGALYLHFTTPEFWEHEIWARFTSFNLFAAIHMNSELDYINKMVEDHWEEFGLVQGDNLLNLCDESLQDFQLNEHDSSLDSQLDLLVESKTEVEETADEGEAEETEDTVEIEYIGMENKVAFKSKGYKRGMKKVNFATAIFILREDFRKLYRRMFVNPEYTKSTDLPGLLCRFKESSRIDRPSSDRNVRTQPYRNSIYRC